MWCSEGLEALFDLTEWKQKHHMWEKSKIWDILKDSRGSGDSEPKIPLQHMILRARVNSQRCYEIYTFAATDSIDEATVRKLFEENPQFIVDFIRANGDKIYSDRSETNRKVIS
jgi:hypothetical protein